MSDKKRVHQGKNNDVLERIQWNRSNLPSIASNSLSLSLYDDRDLSFFFLFFPPFSPLPPFISRIIISTEITLHPSFFHQNDEGNLNEREDR